ncbi:hypothetical protein [Candidatus Amarobacter glycogenicus]|uniref:hypothetical protein n=1 Tax=Candidatus Amarobacter glycogenicus TaxID=3140699 RepID=UPI003136B7C0|nr:hypothetical protein [Dehalococcoidia bacterium]
MASEDASADAIKGGAPWRVEAKRIERQLTEALDFAALTPDIAFVAFLKACSQFGFFRFGPITLDVDVLEDILLRTHPRGDGGPEYPLASEESIALGRLGWDLFRSSEVSPANAKPS